MAARHFNGDGFNPPARECVPDDHAIEVDGRRWPIVYTDRKPRCGGKPRRVAIDFQAGCVLAHRGVPVHERDQLRGEAETLIRLSRSEPAEATASGYTIRLTDSWPVTGDGRRVVAITSHADRAVYVCRHATRGDQAEAIADALACIDARATKGGAL